METNGMSVCCYLITNLLVARGNVVYIRQGGSVTLDCIKLSDITIWQGPPNFKTYTSGSKTNPNSSERISVTSDNNQHQFNLNIEKIQEEDEGHYRCARVFANKDIDYQTYELKFAIDPKNMKIIGQNSKKFVYGSEGKPLTLECEVMSGNPPEILYFVSGNNTLIEGGPSFLKYSFVPIRNDHNKEITCTAVVNETLYTLEETFTLHISCTPYFVSANKAIQYGLYGHKTEIIVYVVSIPPPHDITISRNGSETDAILVPMSDVQTFDTVYGKNVSVNTTRISYRLYPLTVYDFKPYLLQVKNRIGTSAYIVTLKSKTQIKAVIKALPSAVVSEGDSLTLVCENVDNQVPVQITWGGNNKQMSGNGYTVDNTTIFFHSIIQQYAGNYSCEMNSVLGNDTESLLVTVRERKQTPLMVLVLIGVTVLTITINIAGICCQKGQIHPMRWRTDENR